MLIDSARQAQEAKERSDGPARPEDFEQRRVSLERRRESVEAETAALWREFEDEADIVERLLSHGSTGAQDRAGQRGEQGRLRRADEDVPEYAGVAAVEFRGGTRRSLVRGFGHGACGIRIPGLRPGASLGSISRQDVTVHLPVMPPVKPMLAKLARELPPAEGMLYEPKWDGFRCIVFRDGDEVELGSRNERPLTRYFPDVVEVVRAQFPERCVVDGEIVIATDGGLDFDALQLRLHPADSRVRKLAAETPASFVAFDVLALGDRDLRSVLFRERRSVLEGAFAGVVPPVHMTPATDDRDVAVDWFRRFEGAGLDGVVAKPLDMPYREDQRVMLKVKHERTADCVVAGFRWHKSGGVVGSLLLGLYDDDGVLHHVGVAASFKMDYRRELVEVLAPYRVEAAPSFTGRGPGGPSRWNAGKDLSFEPLRPELVVEVAYDHLQGDRFRHATTFRRWRPDRDPSSCTYSQLETTPPELLSTIFH